MNKKVAALLNVQTIMFAVIAVLLALAYMDTFTELWKYWTEGYNWQFLVPIAFLYMLWERKDLYVGLTRKPDILPGLLLLILGCVLLVAGQLSSTQSLREISIIINVFGLVFLLFGKTFVKNLFWPLVYLVLMTSLTSDLLGQLRDPLKLISATVSADILQMLGYVVYREGVYLYLPYITLEVADSCSGLNQMISSIALGIPIAYTMLNTMWKRVFIILISLLLGLIMNWVRVILISIWHYHSAKETIHGPYDIYGLPFIFLIGVFLTLILAMALKDKNEELQSNKKSLVVDTDKEHVNNKSSVSASIIAILVLSLTAFYLNTWTAKPVDMEEGFTDMPRTIAGYQGKLINRLEKPFFSGVAHNEYIANFTNQDKESVSVYIGYFHSQNQEDELIDYRYNWLHNGAEKRVLASASPEFSMKKARAKLGSGKATVFFSYDINGKNLIDPRMVKLTSLLDAILRRRSNGAIIIVMFNGDKDEITANEEELLVQFMKIATARVPGD